MVEVTRFEVYIFRLIIAKFAVTVSILCRLCILLQIIVDSLGDDLAAFVGNFGIDVLCGSGVGVTEQRLCVLDVNVCLVKQRSVTMPELMGGQGQTGLALPVVPRLVKKVFFHQLNSEIFINIKYQIYNFFELVFHIFWCNEKVSIVLTEVS